MKQLIPIIIFAIALNSFAQTDTLKLSSDVWPPFTNTDNEKSIAIDLVEKALERISVKSTFEISDFDTVMSRIHAGRYNGSPAFWKNAEREQTLFYSDPYLENQLIVVGRKGADVSFKSLSELKPFRIGLVKDYAYSDSLIESNGFDILFGNSDQDNLEKLISNEIDYMLVDAILIQYLLKYELNDVSAILEFAKHTLISKPLYFVLNKNIPNAKDILAQFNKEIKKMMADGVYNELLGLNWIRADINGDGIPELILNGDYAGTEAPVNAYDIYDTGKDSTSGYYVNQQYYENWEDVPESYKVPKKIEAIPVNPEPFGMTLNF